MEQFLNKLNNYWFKPIDIKYLSLTRIVIVGFTLVILLYENFVLYDNAKTGGNTNLIFQKWLTTIEPSEYNPMWVLKFLLAPLGWNIRPEILFIDLVWASALIFGMFSLIGLYTRLSLFIFAAANTFLVAHAYSYNEYHHPESIVVIALWILAFGYNKNSWSIDNLKNRIFSSVDHMTFKPVEKNKSDEYARWPLLLMQWVFVFVYFSAGLEKLLKSGFDWLNGYTLAYSFAIDGFLHGHTAGVWAAGFPVVLQFFSVFSILFETTFIFALLFPRIAWIYVAFAISFHAGSYILQATPFIFYYLPVLIVFIEPIHQKFKKENPVSNRNKKWTIVYDGLCPLCIRSIVTLNYIDIKDRLSFLDFNEQWNKVENITAKLDPETASHYMHVVDHNGNIYRGFFAFKELSHRLVLLSPLIPILHLPFLNKIGPWVYDKIASSRKRICRVDNCIIY